MGSDRGDLDGAALGELNKLADAISAVSITGDFSGALRCESHDETVQKLFMMVNLLFDTIDSSLREARTRNAELEQQRALIASISAPVIEVWDGVITLPLVGPLDAERADQVQAHLLSEVARTRARHVIVDLTGVDRLQAGAGAALVRVIRAVRLLGAEPVLVGLSPQHAQEFAAQAIDLDGTTTLRDLREALRRCIGAADRR